jgi:hypothetical protein
MYILTGLTRSTDDVTLLEVAVNPQGTYVAGSYQNGDIRVYRYPLTNQSKVSQIYMYHDNKVLKLLIL